VASDEDWRPQRRVDLIPSYKAHRLAEPVPPDLDPQMPLVTAVLSAIGLDFVGAPGMEAEDVIASWVEQLAPARARVEIVSGDRDLFGLVREREVMVLYPEKGGMAEVDEAEVTRRYGIPGRAYADFAVLRGDPSDGLPGVRGIGAKKAAELVTRYGGVRGLLEAGRLGKADADYVARALAVVLPHAPAPVPVPEGRRPGYPVDPEAAERLKTELGLGSSLERLVQELNAEAKRHTTTSS
jgi:5'-3' exonuclease